MTHRTSVAFEPLAGHRLGLAVFVMGLIVVGSNILVQYPINNWLTWGALSYPCAFLVADLLNRRFGPAAARRVAYIGFMCAIIVSFWVATPRIALGSGLAFLVAQLLDIYVFDRLRNRAWWQAPFIGGAVAAALDTVIFFAVAFAGTDVPWVSLLMGDLLVKLALNAGLLAPFRALMWNIARPARG